MTNHTRVADLTEAILKLPNDRLENLRTIASLSRNLANARYQLTAKERGGDSSQSKDRTEHLIQDRSLALAVAIDEMLNSLHW